MRFRALALLLVLLLAPASGRAAVVVVGNYTDVDIAFTVAEPNAKARPHKLASNHVLPVYVTGPADLTFTAKGREVKMRVEVYNAYVFLPDRESGFKLEGLELPGEAPERDAKPELTPIPRDPPVKIPVTLLVDDIDPRADKLWQTELRKRFDEAAGVIEQATSVRFEFAGFDTWKSDPEARNTTDLLTSLETAVKPKDGAIVVGYSSRKIDDKVDPSIGQSRGLGGRHILMREWKPRGEPERVEALVHFLAKSLGGVGSPDPGSALRAKLGDGYALRAGAVTRLDPLNALVLNLWADERRRDPAVTLDTLSAVNRVRITRLYKALLKAAPGDALATNHLNGLDRDIAKNPEPPAKNPPDRPATQPDARDELVRGIVKAVTTRAKQNAALGAEALKGDELTAAYVRAAARQALRKPGPEMVSAFLLALGVALDETGALADDATTANAVKNAETLEERKDRLAVLGNPTLAGRRDLCRRFFLGCAAGELLDPDAAENVAIGRAQSDLQKPANLCVPALAAEFAGNTFARAIQRDVQILNDVDAKFGAADYLPSTKGLRDGLSAEKFEEVYGDTNDDRFRAVLADIRTRVREMKAYK